MTRYSLFCLPLMAFMLMGFEFRCYMFCHDQTAIQEDYVKARDICRENAQLKIATGYREPAGGDIKGKNALLVALVSDCMEKKGWSVPDGRSAASATGKSAAAEKSDAAKKSEAEAMNEAYLKRAAIARKTECAFARQAAANSAISASRAKACDLECSQRLRAAPDAPRPAACPSEHDERFRRGVDRE